MIGVIDVGGGTRDIYGAGVLDYCLENSIRFDYCIGVSSGSANCASYVAGQKGRNYTFYTEYSARKEYMGFRNFVKTGSFINLNYIYGTLTNSDGENPIDYPAMSQSSQIFKIVATDADTGKPVYFDKSDMLKDKYNYLMASCCMPVVCRPCEVDGTKYYDGGVSDPVPIDKALADGCDKVVLILSKPITYNKHSRINDISAKMLRRKYEGTAVSLTQKDARYNDSLAKALDMQKRGKALVIAPDDIGKVKTLTTDKILLDDLYKKGYKAAEKIAQFVS